MKFNRESTAQGAIEYLLIIGAAILIVAVVIIALSGVLFSADNSNDMNDLNKAKSSLRDLLDQSKNQGGTTDPPIGPVDLSSLVQGSILVSSGLETYQSSSGNAVTGLTVLGNALCFGGNSCNTKIELNGNDLVFNTD